MHDCETTVYVYYALRFLDIQAGKVVSQMMVSCKNQAEDEELRLLHTSQMRMLFYHYF